MSQIRTMYMIVLAVALASLVITTANSSYAQNENIEQNWMEIMKFRQ